MNRSFHRFAATAALLAAAAPSLAQTHSELWGENGEGWSADSRLPDWSVTGFERGEAPIPTPQPTHNVRDFGALGDAEHDDTEAFRAAIAAAGSAVDEGAESAVVLIPAGRYRITDRLDIRSSRVVLRGEGEEQTTLYFPRSLTDVEPNWTSNTSGRRTSNYSWSGGFIRVRGRLTGESLGGAGPAQRGDDRLPVNDTDRFEPSMEVMLTMSDDEGHTFTHYIYAGDPGPIDNIGRQIRAEQVFRVTEIDRDTSTITLDRPLRFDVREQWGPELLRFEPTVTHVGVESMTLEFPGDPYNGHFTELGYNGIAMSGVAHCWVRNIRFVNAESGVFLRGCFSTLDNLVYESKRDPDRFGNRGHHAVTVAGTDNLTTGFDFRVRYIHDITVTRGSIGNVFASGRGVDVNFDHHRRGPYENLFTDIDAGLGLRVWASGGGAALGRHAAARATFWNIRSERPIAPPGRNFAPAMINIVGVNSDAAPSTEANGLWFEPIDPERLRPQNLHEAQRQRRLEQSGS